MKIIIIIVVNILYKYELIKLEPSCTNLVVSQLKQIFCWNHPHLLNLLRFKFLLQVTLLYKTHKEEGVCY